MVARLTVNFRCRFDSRPRDSSWILGDGGGGGKGAAGTVRVGKEKVRKLQLFLMLLIIVKKLPCSSF
jgi:hypothetical protein